MPARREGNLRRSVSCRPRVDQRPAVGPSFASEADRRRRCHKTVAIRYPLVVEKLYARSCGGSRRLEVSMNRWLLSGIAVLGLAACGPDAGAACEDYVSSAELCAEGGGIASGIPANYCDAFSDISGAAARDATDKFECFVNVIRSGDCTSEPDARDTLSRISQCQ